MMPVLCRERHDELLEPSLPHSAGHHFMDRNYTIIAMAYVSSHGACMVP
jgi:hypothetical protein